MEFRDISKGICLKYGGRNFSITPNTDECGNRAVAIGLDIRTDNTKEDIVCIQGTQDDNDNEIQLGEL